MKPYQLYNRIKEYGKTHFCKIICELHSACSSTRLCDNYNSIEVINFDEIKIKADIERGCESRKSVDAVTYTPKNFCFIELKSWTMFLKKNKVTEGKIQQQAKIYESSLPAKLFDSISICEQIEKGALKDSKIIYILLSDISAEKDGLANLNLNLSALAGTSSSFEKLCNDLSKSLMKNKIYESKGIETRYWYCQDFESNIKEMRML